LCCAKQFDPPKAVHGGVIENRTPICRSVEADILNPVVGRKPKAIRIFSKSDGGAFAFTFQSLSGGEEDRWCVDEVTTDQNLPDACVLRYRDQLLDRRYSLLSGCCSQAVHSIFLHGFAFLS
jgi:hypothetical protein